MFKEKENYKIEDLISIVKMLRSPEGCPWDRKQNHKSIRNNMLEESYEVIEAIDNDNPTLLREELGDVLLQIIMHSQFEEEVNNFNFDDVCNDICKKLVFRHPHVFGQNKAESPDEALSTWEDMKKIEKNQVTKTETLLQVSKALPALMYSQKIQNRAAKTGFDYENLEQAFGDLKSEQKELENAIENNDKDNIYEELGDLLFSAVNVARFLNIDSEQALYDSNAKFVSRFQIVEQLADKRGINVAEASLDLLNGLWNEAKQIKEQNLEVLLNDKG